MYPAAHPAPPVLRQPTPQRWEGSNPSMWRPATPDTDKETPVMEFPEGHVPADPTAEAILMAAPSVEIAMIMLDAYNASMAALTTIVEIVAAERDRRIITTDHRSLIAGFDDDGAAIPFLPATSLICENTY